MKILLKLAASLAACALAGAMLASCVYVDTSSQSSGEGGLQSSGTTVGSAVSTQQTTGGNADIDPSFIPEFEYTVDGSNCTITSVGKLKRLTVIIPEYIDGYRVTGIANEVFAYCMFTLDPENEVLSDDRGFSISIPSGVTSIGRNAFGDYFSEINVSSGNTSYKSIDGVLFTYDGKTLVRYPEHKSGEKYTIPEGVTNIGKYAFYECTFLKSVTISDSVTDVEESSFAGCPDLVSVTIGNGVKNIGFTAFWRCKSLSSITIPDNVTSIGQAAFNMCSALTSITIGSGVTSIDNYAFSSCESLTSINVSAANKKYKSIDGVLFTYDKVPSNYEVLVSYPAGKKGAYVIPEGITVVCDSAFLDCTGLTNVTIPDSITSIVTRAFFNCSGLTTITYTGTVSEWENISKEANWDKGVIGYTVVCTDGSIKK